MRFILAVLALAVALFLSPGVAIAQNCSGQPAANTVCAGPASGGAGLPGFRATVAADMPAGVATNALHSVTSNYSIATTDCGKTIQAGTGSTGFFTITVPSVTGFDSACVVVVTNGDTARAKGIAGISLGNGSNTCGGSCLWPKQTTTLRIVNGAWTATNPGRWLIPNNTTCYVDAINGNDSNDCLAPGAGSAVQSIFTAINKIAYDQWDRLSGSAPQVTIQLADNGGCAGTPYAGMHISGNGVNPSGNAALVIQGNAVTPTNVCVKDASAPALAVFDGAFVEIKNFALAAVAGQAIISQAPYTTIRNEGGIVFSGSGGTGQDIFQQNGATFINDGGYTIAGASAFHLLQSGVGSSYAFSSAQTVTCTTSPAYTDFVATQGQSTSLWNNVTFSGCGSVTGPRYNVSGLGLIVLEGVTLPGNAAGSVTAGGNLDVDKPIPPTSGGTGTQNVPTAGQILIGTAGGVYNPQTVTNCTLTSGGNLTCPTGSGVPQNLLNTQTANYSIQTTDCGKTIQAGTGTTGLFTVTLPAVAGFASNCVLDVYNGDSLRGKILSGFPVPLASSPTNILWAGDTIQVGIVNGAWAVLAGAQRHRIVASTTLFVDTTNGNDANDCLASTTGACKTINGAISYLQTWDGNAQTVTISVADGTYTNQVLINGPFHGNPTVNLQGDLATPANCIISTTSATDIIVQNGAAVNIGGFKITNSGTGNGILALNGSFITINGAMEYGAIVQSQIVANSSSAVTISSNYTISGGAQAHWNALQSKITAANLTITLTGTPAFSLGFAEAQSGGNLQVFGNTYSGSATGPRFNVIVSGFIFTNQTSATYFPGNASGTISSGGTIDSLTSGAPTATGTCSVTSQSGGNVGQFTASGACAGGTYILTFGAAAAHGWACSASDQTTAADFTKVNQTASSTTSATFTATTANSDVVSYICSYY